MVRTLATWRPISFIRSPSPAALSWMKATEFPEPYAYTSYPDMKSSGRCHFCVSLQLRHKSPAVFDSNTLKSVLPEWMGNLDSDIMVRARGCIAPHPNWNNFQVRVCGQEGFLCIGVGPTLRDVQY